ncbi:MAG: serine/threonine-protein kinase [Candidatus Eremiobacterota bacterium]
MRETARLSKDTVLGDKYKIVQVLSGEGEENDLTYIAFDIYNPEKNVLIRELVFSISDDKFRKEVIDSLEERIKHIINISHENLSPVFDIFTEDEKEFLKYRVYIVTEAENAGRLNLVQAIKEYNNEEIPFDKIKEWGEQICDALSALHNSAGGPIIFYDLRPENILLTGEGKIKLTDYGLSRMLDKGFSHNKYMGTPGYSAPEQYGLKPVDTRADIFGVGALLYYMLTKEDPRNNPLNFSPLRGKKELGEIATKCIDFNLDKRIQKIDEVRALLGNISPDISQARSVTIKMKQKIETGKTLDARPQSFIGEICNSISWNLKKFWYAHMNQLIAIGAICLLCLAGVAIMFATSRGGGMERVIVIGGNGPEIVSMDIKKPENLELFKTKNKLVGEAVLSRNGKYIYAASSPDLLGCFDLEKNQMATHIKVGTEPRGMCFSPVQNYLAVTGSASDCVTLVDTDYNNPVATLKSNGKGPVAVCFSSTGQELFVVNKTSATVDSMEITGNLTGSIKINGSPVDIINPDYNNKLYLSVWDKNQILVIDGDKRQIISEIKTSDGPGKIAFSRDRKMIAVACGKSQEVILVSIVDDRVIDKIKFQNIPCSLTFSKDGKQLYTGTTTFDHALNYIYVWDLDNRTSRKVASPAITATNLIFVASDVK